MVGPMASWAITTCDRKGFVVRTPMASRWGVLKFWIRSNRRVYYYPFVQLQAMERLRRSHASINETTTHPNKSTTHTWDSVVAKQKPSQEHEQSMEHVKEKMSLDYSVVHPMSCTIEGRSQPSFWYRWAVPECPSWRFQYPLTLLN